MKDNQRITIYRLLWEHKRGFIIYLFAAFLPILQQLIQEGLFSFSFSLLDATTSTEISARITIMVTGMLIPAGLYWISRRLRIGFMRDILLTIRKLSFRHILSLPVRVFSRKSRDEHLSHLVNDINIIENDFFVSFLNVIFNVGLTLITICILLVLDWRYGLAIVLATFLVALLGRFFRKRIVTLKQQESEANKDFSKQMSNVYSGLEILKLNRVEEPFRIRSMGYVTALEKVKMRFNIFDHFQSGTMGTLGLVFQVLSFLYVGMELASGRISLVQGIFMTMITQRAIWSMVQIFPHLNKLRASEEIFDRIVNGDDEERQELLPSGTGSFALNHALKVDNLSFSYEGKPVLRHASFSIKRGEKILLKGASGSGKTTLLNLLAGVHTSYDGTIDYDGKELKNIDPILLNHGIAEIYQDVFLFEDTLRNNITLFGNYEDSDILKAVDQAGLRELVERLPQGLYTPLEENGKNLSGGERQRVSIARAVIKESSLLLADEATSNLDETLGRLVEATLLSLDATVIAISHRHYDGVTKNYDRVLEIDAGTLSEWHVDDYFREVV